jgi:hypothetical protein
MLPAPLGVPTSSAGRLTPPGKETVITAPWGTSGFVPWIFDWASRSGKLVSVPAHGDVFFLNPTDSVHSHMGLVAGADPAHHLIYTCEGNWSDRVLSQNRDYHAGDIRFARI